MNLKKVKDTGLPGIVSCLAVMLAILGAFSACRRPAGGTSSIPACFSLHNYFTAEISRLQQEKPAVLKTIEVNGKLQQRKIASPDWTVELGFFTSSDINKPAWLGKYRADSSLNRLAYTALDPELKVRRVEINRTGKKISSVKVSVSVHNFLYSLSEELSYYPDSAYTISRSQHINILGTKVYHINGLIIH